MKIAIIDDSEADRYIARRVLRAEYANATVLEYAEANAALETIRNADPDAPLLVFLDINMPRVSGFDILEELHAEAESPAVVVILLTSSAAEADRQAAANYTCVRGYIEKPLTRARLQELARSLPV